MKLLFLLFLFYSISHKDFLFTYKSLSREESLKKNERIRIDPDEEFYSEEYMDFLPIETDRSYSYDSDSEIETNYKSEVANSIDNGRKDRVEDP